MPATMAPAPIRMKPHITDALMASASSRKGSDGRVRNRIVTWSQRVHRVRRACGSGPLNGEPRLSVRPVPHSGTEFHYVEHTPGYPRRYPLPSEFSRSRVFTIFFTNPTGNRSPNSNRIVPFPDRYGAMASPSDERTSSLAGYML